MAVRAKSKKFVSRRVIDSYCTCRIKSNGSITDRRRRKKGTAGMIETKWLLLAAIAALVIVSWLAWRWLTG
jgi:hypothetical protein